MLDNPTCIEWDHARVATGRALNICEGYPLMGVPRLTAAKAAAVAMCDATQRAKDADKMLVLAIQPEPIDATVHYITMPSGAIASGIRRDWAPGDAEKCTRCDHCNVRRNVCFVMANWEVDEGEGRHFWPKRYKAQPAPAPASSGWRTTKGAGRKTGRSAPL